MRIIDLTPEDEGVVRQVAALLFEAFREHWPEAWPDMDSALEEVRESFAEGRISRVAVGEGGEVLGWIGGLPEYDGRVWELHPLAVNPAHQRQGIGSTLVADLEEQVRQRGGLAIMLGSDDDDNMTTLSGVDLYPNVWEHIGRIRNLKGHPYEFYQKLGFTITGIVPDANGWGKPDILMAKRVKQQPEARERLELKAEAQRTRHTRASRDLDR
ncbi:MAG TPA: GNAT family N-acetyltransferase [Chloroflexia bacterium]